MRTLCLSLGVILSVAASFAASFDTEAQHVQDYVVSRLVNAVNAGDRIVIIQSQEQPSSWEAYWREEIPEEKVAKGISFDQANWLGLLLGFASPVESLKGSTTACVDECALFYDYEPSGTTAREMYRPYFPLSRRDKMCYLAFVRPQREPLKDRILIPDPDPDPDHPREEEFVKDALTLPPDTFLKKHNLEKIFAQGVYAISEGGLFLVNHPQFKMTDDDLKYSREESYSILLSHQEVSEIVYLAYLHEDSKGGAATYAEAVRQSLILQPMPKAEFKTLVGQRLHAALSDPEYGMAEKRAQEEKEKQQRELAEQWNQLRKQVHEMMSAIEKADRATLEQLKALETVVTQFQQLPYEKNDDDDVRTAIERDGNTKAEKLGVLIRYLKILMSKEHEALDPEIRANAHIAWFLIKSGLENPNFQVAHVKQYDDILRKVQGLPLDPEQVKELEDAIAEMEANRKKYAR